MKLSRSSNMAFKAGILVLTLFIGSYAFPAVEQNEVDLFDHTNPSERIVGGSTAGSVPHMVALVTGIQVRSLLCGGSLITQRHILTAAHCMVPVTSGNTVSSNLRGVMGTNRWNSGGVQTAFSRGIIHSSYRPSPILKNDIGILVTSANVALSNAVRLVSLNWNWIGANVATSVTGWGRTSAGGAISAALLQLRPRTVDGAFCRTEVPRVAALNNFRNVPAVDPNIEICTFLAVRQGTCNGDSGSPLISTSNGQQIGIVSWGIPCALGAPDMFVRTSAYRSWIQSNT